MRQLYVRVGAFVSLIVLISGVFAPLASAADPAPTGGLNIVVSPVSQTLEVQPGGSVTTKLQIKNQGIATEHLQVTVKKFGAKGALGVPTLDNPGPADDFVNWASISPAHFDAQPNVWVPVQVTINPPKSAAFGYYYAILFSREGVKTQAKQANLLGAVASLILLDVQAPGAVRKANITEFSTNKNVSEFLPVVFSVTMHNSGNVHVAPRGNIFITKGGKSVALLEVNLSQGNILPGTNRVFTTKWDDGTPSYKFKMVDGKVALNKQNKQITQLDWSNFNMSKLRFGEYHAKLVMVYNDGKGDVSTEAVLNFWVIPWRIIFVVILIIVLIGAGLWALLIRPIRNRSGKNRRGNARFR